MKQPETTIEIKMADGIFVKSTLIPEAGTILPQHAHSFDHLSMIASGAVRVWQDGELLGDFSAPVGILIKARAKHKFLSLENNTLIYCIHNLHSAEAVDIAEEHILEELV